MLSIAVYCKSSGNPKPHIKVAIGWAGFGGMSYETTNSSGDAHFDHSPCNGIIYVDGSKVKEGHLSGRIVVYI